MYSSLHLGPEEKKDPQRSLPLDLDLGNGLSTFNCFVIFTQS